MRASGSRGGLCGSLYHWFVRHGDPLGGRQPDKQCAVPDFGARRARTSERNGVDGPAGRGLTRTWRTSAVGDVVRGFDERPASTGRAAVYERQAAKIELRLGSARLSGPAASGFPERVAVRHSSSVTRPAPRRTAILGVLATFAGFALLPCGVAAASITLFEPPLFSAGPPPGAGLSVNGQSGVGGYPWKSAPPGAIPACVPTPTNGQYDQAVVANTGAPPGDPPGFGSQSLRMSNACASSEFFYQTYSAQEPLQVGEERLNKVFLAEFAFMSTTPDYQPGLFLSVSPDSGEGSRMSWVGLEDTPAGVQVSVNDTPDVDGKFVAHPGPLLDRSVPHTITFWIKVNPGIDNDVVRILIDAPAGAPTAPSADLGQCFTTWENYYRTAPEQAPPPNRNTPATINSLQFRSSVPGPPALAGGGYLFDNVSITPSNGPGPPPCDEVVDKKADQQTVRAGGLAGYQITARNRGRVTDRNVQVCDRVPRQMTFVRADRKLTRVGGRRCLLIPRLAPGQRVNFHIDLRVDANASPGLKANIADVTPGVEPPGSPVEPPGSPVAPPGSPVAPAADPAPGVPAAPGARPARVAVRGTRTPVRTARATVRVLPRPTRPSFTG